MLLTSFFHHLFKSSGSTPVYNYNIINHIVIFYAMQHDAGPFLSHRFKYIIIAYSVFPPKDGNMVLPHPLRLKFILKNNTDWTLLTKHYVPWMHSPILNIYPRENTDNNIHVQCTCMYVHVPVHVYTTYYEYSLLQFVTNWKKVFNIVYSQTKCLQYKKDIHVDFLNVSVINVYD